LVKTGRWVSWPRLDFLWDNPTQSPMGQVLLGKSRDFLTSIIAYCAWRAKNTIKCVNGPPHQQKWSHQGREGIISRNRQFSLNIWLPFGGSLGCFN
jgi:hypothetical protein